MRNRGGIVGALLGVAALSLTLSCESMVTPSGRSQRIERGKGGTGRVVVGFNRDWKFAKGEQSGAGAPDFDDSAWQAVRLPHDWAISGPFNQQENGYAGKLPWKGVGWYRKTFKLGKSDSGKRVYLDFDGVMAFPKVYVNGQLAGEWDYGYMSFRIDATPYVKFGGENVVAVLVDTRRHGTRWYPGAGIYRGVRMTVCNPVHIAHWGTFITTPEVSDASATVRVRSTVENHLDSESTVSVEVVLLDPGGREFAAGKKEGIVPAGGSQEVEQSLVVAEPRRWDVESPELYTARTVVRMGGKIVDAETTSFGIRTFEFTANDGFHLNGRRVQLYGVNLHHDQGPLGAAFYTRAMERQLEIMKDMGCNALRTSHNPPAPQVLDLCDRMGIVVWDECFDKWDSTSDRLGGVDLVSHNKKQLCNFVMRDRNHPCVVTWSIGNEIADIEKNASGRAAEQVRQLGDYVRELDGTRPVGMGCYIPSAVGTGVLGTLDLTGWNYDRRYANARKQFPDMPLVYSESASALSTRGFYELPLPQGKTQYSKKTQVDSYDLNSAQWSDIPDVEFQLMEDDPFIAGEFVWTGFDYLGEPTPFNQEARSSYFGIVGLCGIAKDRFFLYRSYWRPAVRTIHILPHWNWPERIGKTVPVFVYTNGDSAELFLNGKSLGRRAKKKVLDKPVSLAAGKPVKAGSEETDKGNLSGGANDGDSGTRWCASSEAVEQWWQVDLGEAMPIRYLDIDFEREARDYQYRIKASTDGSTWQTVASKDDWAGDDRRIAYEVDAQGRYVRIEFTRLQPRAWASIREFGVYSRKVESSYYAVTEKYRLRWNGVVYEPGELKAVAYKDGEKIGEAFMRTAGKPAAIRLTPDREEISATGEDLAYILVEAIDEKGMLCPLAEDLVHFEVEGPAEIAGLGNGNPLSLEPFQADYRRLFYGKAMLILRSVDGQGGRIEVAARADGMADGHANIRSKR